MGTDIDAAREALGTVPPGKPADPSEIPAQPAEAGPTSPGRPDGRPDAGPESGGYDNRPSIPASDNRKGGYGAG